MKNNSDQTDIRERKPFSKIYTDTYDKVPQPESELIDLFQKMQGQSEDGNQHAAKKNKSSR